MTFIARHLISIVVTKLHQRHGAGRRVFLGGEGTVDACHREKQKSRKRKKQTLDTLRYTRFPSVRTRPLCEPSNTEGVYGTLPFNKRLLVHHDRLFESTLRDLEPEGAHGAHEHEAHAREEDRVVGIHLR